MYMYTLRRWWDRHGLQVLLAGLTLGSAWYIRQTQGAALFEAYQWITRPFQLGPTRQERIESARMLELQERLGELDSENQRLKKLLGYVETQKPKGIVARIIGRSADHWWQQVTLSRGSQDGIKPGFVVMGTGGLVGRILPGVTPHTSRVLLISDPSSQVGVIISRSRHMGYLGGQSSTQAVMQFFDKVPDVHRGDIVATSSVSSLFPAGLPVGRVESVDLKKSPAPVALIELTAPIGYLEWVSVYPAREDIKE